MTIERHGIAIGIDRINDEFLITLKVVGTLTHADYQKITPMIDAALSQVDDAHVRVFMDASEFVGWEIRAAWDDFKLGFKHGKSFEKVALYGHERWQAWVAKLGAWFIAGEVEFFEDADQARLWLLEE